MQNSQFEQQFLQVYFHIINSLIVTFATVILAWLTSRYVRLTKHMVESMRECRDPSVYIDFELPEHMLRFTVGNSGQTSAKNIVFNVVDDLEWLSFFKRNGIASVPIIKSGVSYLTPGRTLKFPAGFINNTGIPSENTTLRVIITYENEAGTQFSKEVVIDMMQYKGVMFESFKDSNIAVAEAIKDAEIDRRMYDQSRSSFKPIKKSCPMCAELIPQKAKKCSHCGELFPVEENSIPVCLTTDS